MGGGGFLLRIFIRPSGPLISNASGRIEFIIVFAYGLVVYFRLLSTPPLDDAVAFRYGQTSVSVR